MGKLKFLTLSLSVLFILSCASPDPPPPKKTVFEPLLQPVERAKAVQDTVNSQADATRKAVDSQERGDKDP
jgi:hypothetical protein